MSIRRRRASTIVYDEVQRKVLLMYRFERGKEKYVLPGGEVEDGESYPQAAVREIKEETNLDIKIDQKLTTRRTIRCTEVVFLANEFRGELKLVGEELDRIHEKNLYRPEWVSVSQLLNGKLPVYPKDVVKRFLRLFKRKSGPQKGNRRT